MNQNEIIIKDTHRGLYYRDGVLIKVLGAGRYTIPIAINLGIIRRPQVEIILIDVRERTLTIKGQEILTADKVAVRVSIIVQFRVTDPRAALHEVENYEDRLYSDVQLAARRSLASMSLEAILTNRNQLSEDILRDVQEVAGRYGVAILRADVKDLVFPGNLQEIMNRVLVAERMSQAQLVEAHTKAEVQQIDAQARTEAQRLQMEADLHAKRIAAQNAAEIQHIETEADLQALRDRERTAEIYGTHPVLLRLQELEVLKALAQVANARLYINLNGHTNYQKEAEKPDHAFEG
jgi:regulator of protease activity HflC (stomatin/prohibitin superfamily)